MAIPAAPTGFYVVQGDGRVFTSWNVVAGATSYSVERSIDNGVTFSVVATPSLNEYEDTTATLGTAYYYRVASVNGFGTSTYTDAQAIIPTMGGEMSLAELDVRCRQRADRLNSNFVSKTEMQSYIMQSMYELYDLLITVYEDYYKAPNAIFYSNGNSQTYPMPNGVQTFFADDGVTSFTPAPIYKLLGLDMGLNASNNNNWVTVEKYNFVARNRYFYPNTGGTIYGVFNCQYRWMGDKLELIPVPNTNQPFRIQYIPRLPVLLKPTDTTTTSISGWLEYVIIDVAIKILQKEESPVDVLLVQKEAMRQRIMSSAANRDAGRPDTISDVRAGAWGGPGFGYGGMKGGW